MGARILAVAAAVLACGCLHLGDSLEAACIKGRLSEAQAAAVNARSWERSPGYCAGNHYDDDAGERREGQAHCEAERFDRVLAAHCSVAAGVARHGD